MGRKKTKKPAEQPNTVECRVCQTDVWKNDPTLGIIYMIGEQYSALCKDCGRKWIQVMDIARERWG